MKPFEPTDGRGVCCLYTSLFSIRSKGSPGGCEVGHSPDSDPYGLRAGGRFSLTIVVATELCQQRHEFRERWGAPGKHFPLDHAPDRLPFAIIEQAIPPLPIRATLKRLSAMAWLWLFLKKGILPIFQAAKPSMMCRMVVSFDEEGSPPRSTTRCHLSELLGSLQSATRRRRIRLAP
jgi:hypothetical protein